MPAPEAIAQALGVKFGDEAIRRRQIVFEETGLVEWGEHGLTMTSPSDDQPAVVGR